jgi:imidazole glycerol phosphate synthase subunit HisF
MYRILSDLEAHHLPADGAAVLSYLPLSCFFCCRYYVVTDRWQKFSDLVVDGATLEALAKNCSEFLVHGVDVEGLKLGVDGDLVELLGTYTTIPTTYAGGVGTMVRFVHLNSYHLFSCQLGSVVVLRFRHFPSVVQ